MKCEICHKRKHLTTHHTNDRYYLKRIGVISEECRRFLRGPQFQHKICKDCHEELNTIHRACRQVPGMCHKCKFATICCYAVVRRN